jgi:hypothetical protein
MKAGAVEFDPRKQRLSYASGSPKPYTLPKLSELQLAVLACARDDLIRIGKKYAAGRSFVVYFVWHFEVTCQVRALTKRRLIKWPGRDQRHDAHFVLTAHGLAELAEHPEF